MKQFVADPRQWPSINMDGKRKCMKNLSQASIVCALSEIQNREMTKELHLKEH
jgi:hypothetical protein